MPRILEDEIANDPLVRGYSGMTDAELLTSLNATDRTKSVIDLSPEVVNDGIDQIEWEALTDANRTRINQLLASLPTINLFGRPLEEFKEVFGVASATASSLNALRTENISRSQEIGWRLITTEKDLRLHTLSRKTPA